MSQALRAVPGVGSVDVSYAEKLARVRAGPTACTVDGYEAMEEALEQKGYQVRLGRVR